MLFRDRVEAGQRLAEKLKAYTNNPDVLVLGLPRGGVPVAFEVARALHAPLDILVVRKLGVPGYEELAMGAVASGGLCVLNPSVMDGFKIPRSMAETIARQELEEVKRRERAYRDMRPEPKIEGRTVILVDDGLATGSTMQAAVRVLRQQKPARLVVAVPVGAEETCAQFRDEVDEIICAATPDPFRAVGLWYKNFNQTSDEEVRNLLQQAWQQETTVANR